MDSVCAVAQTNPDVIRNIISSITTKEKQKETTPRYSRLVDKSTGLVYEMHRLWPQMGADGGGAQTEVAIESLRLWREEVRLVDLKGKLANGDGTVQERATWQIDASELETKLKAARRAVKASRAKCQPPPVEAEVAGIFFLPADKEDGLPARWEVHGQPFGAYFAAGKAIMAEIAWENAHVEQEWPIDQFYALLAERREDEEPDDEDEEEGEEDDEDEETPAPELKAVDAKGEPPADAAKEAEPEDDEDDGDPFKAALLGQLAEQGEQK